MLTIHDDHYPIAVVGFDGTATLDDTQAYLSKFGVWLLHVQSFVIIMHQMNIA